MRLIRRDIEFPFTLTRNGLELAVWVTAVAVYRPATYESGWEVGQVEAVDPRNGNPLELTRKEIAELEERALDQL